jgi:hypothetical protein
VGNLFVSPDGRRFVSGGSDGVRVCDSDLGRDVLTLASDAYMVIGPDGLRIATIGVYSLRMRDATPDAPAAKSLVDGNDNAL